MSGSERVPWPLGALRVVAWSWLGAGLVAAAIIWLNSRVSLTTTRTITAHARLTFQDIETHVSVFRVSMGFASVLIGVTAWVILMVVAWVAENRGRSRQ